MSPYIKKHGYSFSVVVDEDNGISQAYNPNASAPYLVLIGRDGEIKKRILGFQSSEVPQLERDVRGLLGLDAS